MGKLLVGVVAFAGGVGVGLLIAKFYARQQVQSGVDSVLSAAGLGGGHVQTIVDTLVVPAVV